MFPLVNPGVSSSAVVVDASEAIHTKEPKALSSVFCWGSGITSPIKLPLPSNDVEITQASIGRTQKAAVTKNGRLIVWEVSSSVRDEKNSYF